METTSPPAVPEIRTDPAHLEERAVQARDHVRKARSENTQRAYAADWRDYTGWCSRRGVSPLPPDAQAIGLYIVECADAGTTPATLARRLSGLCWTFGQRGQPLDRADPHLREVLAGIRRAHGRPPVQKDALLGADVTAMLEQLGRDLRGLRDRAVLLLGFAGGLRRSEIVGLDLGPGETPEGRGWVEVVESGLLLHIRSKTGWREVEVGPGSLALTCPVTAYRTWIELARLAHGPVFRRLSRDGKRALPDRLSDKHVARLVKATALAAGIRGDLSEGERRQRFAGQSLRAGLATSGTARPKACLRGIIY